MGARRLAGFVHVDGRVYGPDDEVPAAVAKRIVNPKAWANTEVDGDEPAAGEEPEPTSGRRSRRG